MAFPFFSVMLMAVLTLLSKAPLALAMHRHGGYDNRHPRDQQGQLEGWGRRALAAHQNTLEAFPLFAVCVFVAVGAGFRHSPVNVPLLCGVFLVCRVLYVAFYVLDRHALRSLVWGIGWLCCMAIGFGPLWGS